MTMSSKFNPSGIMIKKKTKKTRKPARRTRTKTRKPKYLSLRLQLSSDKTQQSSDHMSCSTVTTTSSNKSQQQLNLFPLHPGNLVEEKDTHDENMAYLFSAADGGATTLTGLLGVESRSSSDEENTYHQSTEVSPSASLTYAYEGQEREREEVALVRTALRNKERDSSEEIYVRYSEVVERRSDEEVTSCDAGCRRNNETGKLQLQRLSLKLDYEEILNAWSDKGPLFIHAGSPAQTVPDSDTHDDDFLAREICNGLWSVPEVITRSKGNGDEIRMKEETSMDEGKVGVAQREASVLRYKEKRRNRLFAKRIRYEVRKLNAEKRPRVKGRFVKKN